MTELSQRMKQILYAAVTEFVATGQPVSSKTLAKKGIELSPASIRNVLADLEAAGYLHQPHTSAGRVPTDRAFRLFIDTLMEVQQIRAEERERIDAAFSEMSSGENVMRETGKLLSELTGTAAVVVGSRAELRLKHLRFIRTMPGELLAVLVMSNGVVENRFLAADAGEEELLRIHNLLDDVIEGRTLGQLHELFERRLASERVQHDAFRRHAFELGEAAVATAALGETDVVIEGTSRLLEAPELQGGEGVRGVMSALGAHQRLVDLLALAAKTQAVVVGHEAGDLANGQLSIVGASYSEQGRPAGTVGIIGPTRMDYPKLVPLVTATADAMTVFMDRRTSRREPDEE
jgi:heat-inducible transcriptional repressor